MNKDATPRIDCPLPLPDDTIITMAHGGGGTRMHALIDTIFRPAFDPSSTTALHDGVALSPQADSVAFTTDSYVVRPLFFPGGDIGTLAVYGTVNDLAMCGAQPLYLSTGFILEEGLPLDTLRRVVESMRAAADAAGVQIVTGDTKVVERGRADGLYINTAGLGRLPPGLRIHPDRIQPGDAIVLSGDIGRHGMAVMAAREGLAFDPPLESDCAPLNGAVAALLEAGIGVHCMRDLTRGGLAGALVELAQASNLRMEVGESAIAVPEPVRGACELLGLDPLYVANEGRFVAFVPEADAERALKSLRQAGCPTPSIIGQVTREIGGRVILKSVAGPWRELAMLSGEQLPRIC